MHTFFLLFALLNLAYFAFIAYLRHRAVRNQRPGDTAIVRFGRWLEFTPGWTLPAFNISPGGYFRPRVQVQIYWIYGHLFLNLPIKTKYEECFPPRYGVSFTDIDNDGWQQIHWHWGRKTAIWDMPWTVQHYCTAYLTKFNTWLVECRRFARRLGLPVSVSSWEPEFKNLFWRQTHPYLYILKNGTAQHRYAELTVVERRWRRKWLPFTSLFGKTYRRIEIEFDREVGERTGTWKGGVLGCSYALLPNEVPEAALRRMEAERKFN